MYENNAEKVCILTLLFAGKFCHLRTPLICFMFFFTSVWGKFGERNNKPSTHVIQSAHGLYSLLKDPSYHISNIRVCSEDVLEVVTTRAEEQVEQNLKTNIFVAVYTTAHACLTLYSALETLQQRVFYYDTDSVIYKWRPGQVEIPLGVFFRRFYRRNGQRSHHRIC